MLNICLVFSTLVIVFFGLILMLILSDRGREGKGAREVSENSPMIAALHVSRRIQGL